MVDVEIRSRPTREGDDTFLDWDGKATLFDEVEEDQEEAPDDDDEVDAEDEFD